MAKYRGCFCSIGSVGPVSHSHMRYLQEEFTTLQVGGQYDLQTKAVFRSLQRNTSNLTSEGIENLKTVVSTSQPMQVSTNNQQGRGFGGFRPHNNFRKGYPRGRGDQF